MLTKQDFVDVAIANKNNYPTLAPLIDAQDPRIMQRIEATAMMLSMLSNQIDLAFEETFIKSRDSTILADSAMRGLINKSIPAQVKIKIINNSSVTVTFSANRTMIDTSGREYTIINPANVLAGSSGYINAIQKKIINTTHTITQNNPFYQLDIASEYNESTISEINLTSEDGLVIYEYRQGFINSLPNENIYDVIVDDFKKVYIVLGMNLIVGKQLSVGTKLVSNVSYSFGKIDLQIGAPFQLLNNITSPESLCVLTFDSFIENGSSPHSMENLRILAKYPNLYQKSAVFLGEFDFLIRANYPDLDFLSVWNEKIQEFFFGVDLCNTNKIFVSVLKTGSNQLLLQSNIERTILQADDTYRVVFQSVIPTVISITINAIIASSFIITDITSQIITVIHNHFGIGSSFSKIGLNILTQRMVYEVLTKEVEALRIGTSELIVSFPTMPSILPTQYRYVNISSANINISNENVITPTWFRGY